MTSRASRPVVVGRITGVYGVKGWVKVFSYTQPRENILSYSPWQLRHGCRSRTIEPAEGRAHGKGLIARLTGIDGRDAAAEVVGADILVTRDQFGDVADDQFYWADLVGLRVATVDGRELGVVDHLLETGTHDVLVLTGERRLMVPFVMDRVVRAVDLENGLIVVDWEPDY